MAVTQYGHVITGNLTQYGIPVFSNGLTEYSELAFSGSLSFTGIGSLHLIGSATLILSQVYSGVGSIQFTGNALFSLSLVFVPPSGQIQFIGIAEETVSTVFMCVPAILQLKAIKPLFGLSAIIKEQKSLLNPELWSKFVEQANKYGYQNNPLWDKITNQYWDLQQHTEETHLPCGHWHKGIFSEQDSVEPISYLFWGSCPQAVAVVGNEIWFITTTDDVPDQLVRLAYNFVTDEYRYTMLFEDTSGDFAWDEPIISIISYGAKILVILAYANISDPTYDFFIVNYSGVESHVRHTDASLYSIHWDLFPTSVISTSENDIRLVLATGSYPNFSYTFVQSTDGGQTFNTIGTIGGSGNFYYTAIQLLLGNLYALRKVTSGSYAVYYLFRSTDGGANWTQLFTETSNLETSSYRYENVGEFNGKLFLVYGSNTYGYEMFIKSSDDGGSTFSNTTSFVGSPDTIVVASTFLPVSDGLLLFVALDFNTYPIDYRVRVYKTIDGVNWAQKYEHIFTPAQAAYIKGPIAAHTDAGGEVIGFTLYYENDITDGVVQAFHISKDSGETWNILRTNFWSHLNGSNPPIEYFSLNQNEVIKCAGPVWPFEKAQNWDKI